MYTFLVLTRLTKPDTAGVNDMSTASGSPKLVLIHLSSLWTYCRLIS